MPLHLFITVKAVQANGNSAISSSNGIHIDTSPPNVVAVFYIDAEQSEQEPTTFQSSNNTIMVYWAFEDNESGIMV